MLIKRYIEREIRNREWRRKNPNNGTIPVNHFDYSCVTIGDYTYGELTILNFGENCKLKIGSFCSIASGVVFNLAGDHYTNHISTFPFKAKVLGEGMSEAISKGDIIVEDDVWIGQNAIIMSGITIGQGAIIAAGAVVNKDVPPYAVVGGVPARVIRYRFSQELIDEMLNIDYNNLSEELIREHKEDLYTELTSVEQLAWLPKK